MESVRASIDADQDADDDEQGDDVDPVLSLLADLHSPPPSPYTEQARRRNLVVGREPRGVVVNSPRGYHHSSPLRFSLVP